MKNIDIFANEYLGKVFYFCLKKTGNEQEAAELSGEISLEVVQALARGKEPEKFDAWVWAVVRNRWARWAAKRYYHAPEQVDIQEYEEALPSEGSVEDDIVHSEELARVRRGLAFIRSDYRHILVAHYFEEKSVSEISRQFGIPLGTVKTRLQSSRKILKEGMDMAKPFGTRSFRPETVRFVSSGSQPSGLPGAAMRRKLPVNILCAADNNASTIEELSMELGIAMPYMEEEVGLLVDFELLRKLDNGRYITNFFISPKECQNEINELSCQFAERNYKVIWDIAGKLLEKGKELGIFSGAFRDADAQAYLAFDIELKTVFEEFPLGIFVKFQRRDGGNWGLIGMEAGAVSRIPLKFFSNSLSEWVNEVKWNGYQSDYGNRPYKYDTPDRNHLYLMKAIAEGRDISNLSVTEEGCLRNLLNEGFCVKDEDGRVQVAALSVSNGDFGKITEYLTALPEYIRLREEKHSYYDEIKKVIERYSTFLLKEDLDYYVGMSSPLRAVLASLWLDKGVYTGGNSRFAALYASALALYAFYAPFLLAYTFLAAGIYGFSVFSLSRKQYGLGKRQINTERRMGYLKDLFKEKNTAKEMRIFGTGAHFFRIWEEANAVYRKERLDMDNKGADYRNIAALADYVLYAGMVFSLLYSVKAGGCDVGTFVMLMGMVSRCNGSIKSICMAECGARSAAIRT